MKKYLITLLSLLIYSTVFAQSADDQVCLDCHGDNTFTTEHNGKIVSLYVNGKAFAGSVHEEISCIGCHVDVDPDDLPHAEGLEKVDCSFCHEQPVEHYNRSLPQADYKCS